MWVESTEHHSSSVPHKSANAPGDMPRAALIFIGIAHHTTAGAPQQWLHLVSRLASRVYHACCLRSLSLPCACTALCLWSCACGLSADCRCGVHGIVWPDAPCSRGACRISYCPWLWYFLTWPLL